MTDETRDPEEALADIGREVAEGDEPSPEEQEFLEGEEVGRERPADEGGGILSG